MGIDDSKRRAASVNDFSWIRETESLNCHFGVWDEGYEPGNEKRFERIVNTERKDFCFYWRHRPGMLLPAAETLQKREAESKEAARDRKLALVGLWIAALALFADVILRLTLSK